MHLYFGKLIFLGGGGGVGELHSAPLSRALVKDCVLLYILLLNFVSQAADLINTTGASSILLPTSQTTGLSK